MSEHVYSILVELDSLSKRKASALPSAQEVKAIWSGIGFRMGNTRFVASMAEVAEVIPVPSFTIVPGVKNWVRGISNVRGRLLPIMDLTSFLQTKSSDREQNQRILIVDKGEMYSGLVVDEVMGMQHFEVDTFQEKPESCGEQVDQYLSGAYLRDNEPWYVFNLYQLADDPQFLQAAVS